MRRIGCEHCAARKRGIIADLSPEELDDFRNCGTAALYKPRQVIFHEGTPADGLYILCRGTAKVYQSDRFGHDHILQIATPGEVLGEMPLRPTDTYSVSAAALTDAQLRFLPRASLVQFIQAHPMTAIRLIEALSKELRIARRRARALALKPAESRLAELLIELANADTEVARDETGRATAVRHKLGYSRRELAEMIGVSTETAIRLIGRLRDKHAIETHNHGLIITDTDKLAELADDERSAAGETDTPQ